MRPIAKRTGESVRHPSIPAIDFREVNRDAEPADDAEGGAGVGSRIARQPRAKPFTVEITFTTNSDKEQLRWFKHYATERGAHQATDQYNRKGPWYGARVVSALLPKEGGGA